MAYLCCPTGFVAFQHTNPLRESRLLEFDRRFALLASKHFVHYDLDEPDKLPAELLGSVDIAIVDPPFLNEVRRGENSYPDPALTLLRATDHEPQPRKDALAHPPPHQRSTPPHHQQLRYDRSRHLRPPSSRCAPVDESRRRARQQPCERFRLLEQLGGSDEQDSVFVDG